MAVTRKDILNDLELVKKGLQEIEFYLKNNVTDDNEIIERGVNGVIDYMRKILKDLVNVQAIKYSQILEDAKKKGLEREFRTAYKLLKWLNFVNYDPQNKLITVGSRTKYLIKLFTNSKFEEEQKGKPKEIDQKKVNEIYYWILDQIIKNEWVTIDTIKNTFKGYDLEIVEAIDKIVSEGKGKLVDNNTIYKVDSKKAKTAEADKSKKIKELKTQIATLERRIQIGRATRLSEEELKKLEEEKKRLEEELKKLENQ